MRVKYLLYLLLSLIFSVPPLYAESYRGIGPFDNLSDIKNKFSGANIIRIQPAWAQENDVLYSITGLGISGTIIIKFYDPCPYCKKEVEESENETQKEIYTKRVSETSDDHIVASWVRWIPDSPFPVASLITKYGNPEKSDFSEKNYQPYKSWESKGITALLSEDNKNVIRIDFTFTDKDILDALKSKSQPVPNNSVHKSKKRK